MGDLTCSDVGCRCAEDPAESRRIVRMAAVIQAADEVHHLLGELVTRHRPFASAHEAYGVIAEEVAELLDEVRRKDDDPERPAGLRRELLDIAAAAIRAAAELGGEATNP